MTDTVSPVLRVLTGRLTGTEKPLPASGTVSIGHQFWQDVVIRDPSTRGVAVDLTTNTDGGAQLTVLEGEAKLLGSAIGAGQDAILPPFVPFSIGGVALAWGDPASERWGEASGIALASPAPVLPPPDARDQALAVLAEARSGVAGFLTGWRLVALGAVVLVLIAALAAVPAIDALGLRAEPPVRVQRALAAAGLSALTVAPDAEGGVSVNGVVSKEAERARAQQVLDGTGVASTNNVQTSAELAEAVAGVARSQGLDAVARPLGRTGVELHTSALNDEARIKLEHAVRADVRQVGRIALRDDLPSTEDAQIKTVADVTKKVSSVVAGDPAYIQTADGARYFPGAIMPTGHRLVAVQENVLILEKNGRETRLAF